MRKGRVKHYIDIVLCNKRVQRLSEGYTVHAQVSGQNYAIHAEPEFPEDKEIAALKAKLADAEQRKAERAGKKQKKSRKITEEHRKKLRENLEYARLVKQEKVLRGHDLSPSTNKF